MKTSKCRGCGAELVWFKTENNRSMPVDASSVEEGDAKFIPGKHIPHWATCPQAKSFRKPREKPN